MRSQEEEIAYRISSFKDRSNAIECSLWQEFEACFASFLDKHQKILVVCSHPVVSMAMATKIPMVLPSVLELVNEAHPMLVATLFVFCRHLESTWFALHNNGLRLLLDVTRQKMDHHVLLPEQRAGGDADAEAASPQHSAHECPT